MTPERWEQVTEIYHAALERDPAERRGFLETACAGDEALLREVESLLEADDRAGDFIARPAFHEAASLLEAEPDAPFAPGQLLGHYKIISRLGAGGMGEVYLGRDSRLNRQVAIKILPASFSKDPNYLRRFQIEAEAAATLNHPHVATVYSVEKADGVSFITMEYVAGKTLDATIPANGFDVKTFLELFIPLADALAHAHRHSVIHRDIKPGNIVITPEGAPKILDFGLAQIDRDARADETESTLKITRPVRITQPGQVFGTPSYMSPEQAEGKPVDHRSDIFSFGVVMYEALTGTRPFRGDNYAAVISNLLKTEPPPVSQTKTETPYLLSRLVSRCLCKSRRERFQSMSEVRAILEETKAAIDAGISFAGETETARPRLKFSAPRKWLAASAILTIALAASAFFYLRQTPPAAAPINFANMTLRKLSQSGDIGYAQITPDGKSIVYITLDESEGRTLWIRRIGDRSALPLVAKSLRQFWGGIGVAPDGSQIFYIQADENARFGTLYRISSLGGAPRKLIENANDVGAVSPDGQRILFVRYLDKMQILSANAADGGDERVVYSGNEKELFRDPQFSADGQSVFVSRRRVTDGKTFWTLLEIPLAGGDARAVLEANGQRIGELAVLKDGRGLLINKTDDVSKLQQLYFVALPDGAEQRLTNDLNSYQGVSVSADGKTIAATQNQTMKDIWLGRSAENMRRLTTESNVFSNAAFTPDGRIVYDALDNNRPHIWIVNADGSEPQQLTTNDSFNAEPQVSPDGRFIVFSSDRTGENKIWRMNTDGSSPQLLTDVRGPAFSPVISPDSRTVWFQWIRDNQQILAKIPLTGGEIAEQQPAFGDNLWAVSPDGKLVASSFFDRSSNQFKVRVRPVDAEEPAKIFNIPASFILEWTPDSKNLLYRSLDTKPEMFSIVWSQPLAGGEPKQFLSVKPDRVTNLALSPDGKQILIVRSRTLADAVLFTKITND
ncbi:MAG TPA: protein kinase [Pyrinomonadaceae bacterium]|jgi:serine/threonine protein kinase/Tol biopolymer transport system component